MHIFILGDVENKMETGEGREIENQDGEGKIGSYNDFTIL